MGKARSRRRDAGSERHGREVIPQTMRYRRAADSEEVPAVERIKGLRARKAAMAVLPARSLLTTKAPMLRLTPVGNPNSYASPVSHGRRLARIF